MTAPDFLSLKAELVMATDSHVVSPIFFAGGDIGGLSIHGTVNDVAVCGATPLYISCGFILEEGFPLSDLKRIVESMAAAAKEAGSQNRDRATPRSSNAAKPTAFTSTPAA